MPAAGYREAVFLQIRLGRVSEFRDKATAVTSELWVGPNGRVLDCKVVRYTGAKAVADRVCLLMKGRQLKAPRGLSGMPTYAISNMTTGFGSSAESDRLAKDLVRLKEPDRTLPTETREAPGDDDVVLLLAINEMGRTAGCRPMKDTERLAAYCRHVDAEQFAILKDEHGRAVTYLRTYSIRLASSS